MLDMMLSSIAKLNRTIRDLTEITKVQKALGDSSEVLFFEEVMNDVIDDLAATFPPESPPIRTDWQVGSIYFARKNLRSILYNLISNAIKYRAPDRPVEIYVQTRQVMRGDGAFIQLGVRDNGLGIAEEQIPKLFGMFKRLHTHVEGTGIGLYIIKRIAENNGGSIEVKSQLGKGTTFNVYLPGLSYS